MFEKRVSTGALLCNDSSTPARVELRNGHRSQNKRVDRENLAHQAPNLVPSLLRRAGFHVRADPTRLIQAVRETRDVEFPSLVHTHVKPRVDPASVRLFLWCFCV